MFNGQNWMGDPALSARMGDVFPILEAIHENLILLTTAQKLPLSEAEQDQLDELLHMLCPEKGWTEMSLLKFGPSGKLKRVSEFMASLRHHAAALSELMQKG
jgi:hypothetical protein